MVKAGQFGGEDDRERFTKDDAKRSMVELCERTLVNIAAAGDAWQMVVDWIKGILDAMREGKPIPHVLLNDLGLNAASLLDLWTTITLTLVSLATGGNWYSVYCDG